jgi:choline-sulfatase
MKNITNRILSRRDFLTQYAMAATGGIVLSNRSMELRRSTKRPNILMIMSDEHNAGVTGCYGNQIVHTPSLDLLAQRGITFEDCYCNSPLCVPSRLSFTSGKYVSRVGAWNNSCWLPSDDYPSLPRILNAAGYESFLCGKMHYDRTRRYGFTEIGGNMNNGNKNGKGSRRSADNLAPKDGISGRFNNFYTDDDSSILTHDRKVTVATIDFLDNRKPNDKPFFLFAGYLAPHFPLIVPHEYWKVYEGKVPMPEIPAGHLESQVRNHKHLRTGFNVEDVPDDIVRKGRELYYGLTQWLDDEIAKVLKALDDSGLSDDTVVIYTTDHGENIGEHGLWWKNCMYEHAARVPLIISYPPRFRKAQRRKGACSLVDLTVTIADIAGTKVPDDWDGDSMVRWMDNPKNKWKDFAVSEYYAHNIASGYAMLRMGSYKYVYHTPADAEHPAERELYDLDNDPGEFDNLAGNPAHSDRIAAMHAFLVNELGEDPDQTELRCRNDYAQGYSES